MSASNPRAAYCTGCDKTFSKMHILINHRRTERCGGRFLPADKRELIDKLRRQRERLDQVSYVKYVGEDAFWRSQPVFCATREEGEELVKSGNWHYRTKKQWKKAGRHPIP